MTRPPPALGVVLGLLLLGVAVGQGLSAQPGRPGPVAPAAVESASAVCADLRQDDGLATRVAAGLAPGAQEDGDTVLERLVLGQGERAGLPTAEAVAGLGAAVDDAAYAVEARGADAAGLTVVVTTEPTTGPTAGPAAEPGTGPERGLASGQCLPARTDMWLLGGGVTVGDTAVLVLANPEPVEAAVDVTVLSAEGAPDERRGRGLTVPAEGRLLVGLETLAPDRTALAVRVQAARGRVAAALRHSRVDGAVAGGLALAAPSAGPAQELVVPGLPAGPGRREVLLANPGDTDVVARVELTTGTGQFVPEGLEELVVPAESTVLADLSESLADTPAAVRVTASDGLLLAAGVVVDTAPGEGGQVSDLAYVAAVPALTGPALVPDLPLDGATGSTLLLSAVEGDAVVDVALRPVAGGQDPAAPARRVEVPGGRTVALAVPPLVSPDFRGRISVVVRPDPVGAPVHASLVRLARPAEGPLLSVVALRGSRPDAPRPRVVRDPAVRAD